MDEASGRRTHSALLIGCGQFGRTFVAQARRLPQLAVAAVCDREPERAAAVLRDAGLGADGFAICPSRDAALAALATERTALIEDPGLVDDAPIDIVVEATGSPEAGARNAGHALGAGRHVAIVTKETEVVVGPILRRVADDAGLVHTIVDGDQPSLLVKLVAWARRLGLPIVAAGKATEYDAVIDPAAGRVASCGEVMVRPGLERHWTLDAGDPDASLAARHAVLDGIARHTVPDLCELGIVANATGLLPDVPSLHGPVLRALELPAVFRPRADGGILATDGALDAFVCLRRPDELSFAGGVFVVCACPDIETGRLFAEKGLPVSPDGRYVMLHNPVHLLGAEAVVSVLEACEHGRASAEEVHPRVDLIAFATEGLRAGTRLDLGTRHAIPGTRPELVPAAALRGDRPAPYYLAAGAPLARDVAAGAPITLDDLHLPDNSALLDLRRRQDATFLGTS